MSDTGIHVDGLKRFVKSLESVGVEIGDLKLAFGSIADRAKDLAAQYVPVRTGALRKSIRGNKAKNYAVVKAGSARIKYAGPINYGWKKRNIPASLFMQRADRQIRPTLLPMLEDAISELLREKGMQ